ncbi:peptide chain release factor-like protein [Candidatus Carsonella ruddii]|uniref:peptide chain release factor-like protein n=1 Tax=Carsonella ruddii TaxID=114186 RepID=UPI003D9A6B8F
MYFNLLKNKYIKNIFEKNFSIFNYNDYKLSNIKNIFEKKEKILFSSCYIEIYPNAGGIETNQLIKYFTDFYYKWLKKNHFDVEIIFCDISDYGYKKSILFINNECSFFLFKNESGIHRIIRKNPLITNNKIQTSYINIIIIPKLTNNKLLLKKEDIIIETFKSKGPGGQHVNNTNSAIRIKHIPTNIVVVCQSERSQLKNKNFAFKILEYKFFLQNNKNYDSYFKKLNNKKYIKTYYFENNLIINHYKNEKYNLNKFFKFEIDFIKI